jgi:hypothetical protein
LTTVSEPVLFLKLLKQAEPVAVLASLSLVIAVFTFEHQDIFQTVYNYSVVSTFMFIFAFLSAVVRNLKFIKSDAMYSGVSSFAFYFFLAIGMIYMLLVAIEFGKQHSQIFSFVNGWLFSLAGGMCAFAVIRILKRLETRQGLKRVFEFAYLLLFGAIAVASFTISATWLILAFTGIELSINPVTLVLIVASGFAIVGGVKTIEDTIKIVRNRTTSRSTEVHGALRWAG